MPNTIKRPGFPATGTISDKEARRSIDALNKAFSDLAQAISGAVAGTPQQDVYLEEGTGIQIDVLGKNKFKITCTVTGSSGSGGNSSPSTSPLEVLEDMTWNVISRQWEKKYVKISVPPVATGDRRTVIDTNVIGHRLLS
jgi:hypothetical protein